MLNKNKKVIYNWKNVTDLVLMFLNQFVSVF